MNKIILVTGASSGFGEMIARRLAHENHIVYAAARRRDKLQQLQSEHIKPLVMDVTQANEVKSGIEQILNEQSRIDVLVNNAGFGYYSTIEDGDIEDVRYQFDVNFFGIMRLTQAVLPSMRNQGAGQIINISSALGKFSAPTFGYYAATKHALEAFSDSLRLEVHPFGIQVVLIEPGAIKSEFPDHALAALSKSHKTAAYDKLVDNTTKRVKAMYQKAPAAHGVADKVSQVVACAKPKARYRVGRDANLALLAKTWLGDSVFDRILRGIVQS